MRYRTSDLEDLPTLCEGQADSLKVETFDTRVWLSRCSVADGEPFDNTITVERLTFDGAWVEIERYDGDV